MIEEFFEKLKESMELHAAELKGGDLFLPAYLTGNTLTKGVFPKVASALARMLELEIAAEQRNEMPSPPEYKCGNYQVVDYVLYKQGNPIFFLELESLDRSQLCTFWDGGVSDENNLNKLWYYYGTLVNHYTYGLKAPKYFVWLLILPDRRVEPYQVWDVTPEYGLFHPSLRKLVCESPYRFYDHLIKAAARLFIMEHHDFKLPNTTGWTKIPLVDGDVEFQDVCELIFITCSVDRLIMSRGKDRFDPDRELSVRLRWRGGPPR